MEVSTLEHDAAEQLSPDGVISLLSQVIELKNVTLWNVNEYTWCPIVCLTESHETVINLSETRYSSR